MNMTVKLVLASLAVATLVGARLAQNASLHSPSAAWTARRVPSGLRKDSALVSKAESMEHHADEIIRTGKSLPMIVGLYRSAFLETKDPDVRLKLARALVQEGGSEEANEARGLYRGLANALSKKTLGNGWK